MIFKTTIYMYMTKLHVHGMFIDSNNSILNTHNENIPMQYTEIFRAVKNEFQVE